MAVIEFEQRGGIAWVTINRPERRNTWTPEAFVLLSDAWAEIQSNKSIVAAVLTGTGDKAFCAGGDLGELIPLFTGAKTAKSELEKRFMADLSVMDKALLKNSELYKPIIAAVNGLAMGGGCEILQACDIRIAADHATFALPEVKRAIVPGGGSMARLARQIPYPMAMEMMLTGEPVSAQQALQFGFLNRVVPAAELEATVNTMAEGLALNGPLAMQAIKEAVLRSSGVPMREAFAIEQECSGRVMASKDAQEGPRAFMEKRKPNYVGE